MIARDNVKRGCRRGKILAGLQRRHVGDDARERRVYYRVGQLARRFVARGNGILVSGMIFDRRIGVAVEVGGKPGQLLLQ